MLRWSYSARSSTDFVLFVAGVVTITVYVTVFRRSWTSVAKVELVVPKNAMVTWVGANIRPPSPNEYNLVQPNQHDFSQIGQQAVMEKYFKGKRNGRFLEVGAFDGEKYSNTLTLERGWEGVLVEPDTKSFEVLVRKNRKAYTLNACLWNVTAPTYSSMDTRGSGGHMDIRSMAKNQNSSKPVGVPCITIGSVFDHLNWTHVDLLSLDTEATEMHIVLGMPFDRITVDYMLIESLAWSRKAASKKMNAWMDEYLPRHGFRVVEEMKNRQGYVQDRLWQRVDMVK